MSADLNLGENLSRSEMLTALTHYYRAEVSRSLAWRERLDRTTSWALGATAAFLGFVCCIRISSTAFSTAASPWRPVRPGLKTCLPICATPSIKSP
jgi:uncharacterized membrane protein